MHNNPETMSQFDFLPPHSVEAEKCFLASALLSASLLAETINTVEPEAFFLADNAIVFNSVRQLFRAGKPVDAVLLREDLAKRGQLEEIGGTAYIAELLNTVPSAANGLHYAAIVREKFRLRQIISACNETARMAYSPAEADTPSLDLITSLQGKLTDASAGVGGGTVTLAQAVEAAIEEMASGGVPCVPTGFRDIDAAYTGLGRGETVVIAARPSMGKSLLSRQIGIQAAERGTPVGIIAAEERAGKIARNLLSWYSGIENNRYRKGFERGGFGKDDMIATKDAADRLKRLPIYITESIWNLDRICAQATEWKMKHGIGLLIVDHLGLIKTNAKTPYESASLASVTLKQLYKRLDIAGISVVQLNRGNTNREDHRPRMSDLRDSGKIEEDADGIILLHREDYYHKTDPNYEMTSTAELIFAKWRDGDTSQLVKLRSRLSTQHFEDMREEVPEMPNWQAA